LFAVGFGGFNVRVIVVAAYVSGVAKAAVIDTITTEMRNRAPILAEGDKS
jgi:hypothetical protein